ncbi:MAG: hypothetical protein M3133_11060 [Actinomycetota bacterium]|nr:hypothetical protein [Actinomycetota bacterium]
MGEAGTEPAARPYRREIGGGFVDREGDAVNLNPFSMTTLRRLDRVLAFASLLALPVGIAAPVSASVGRQTAELVTFPDLQSVSGASATLVRKDRGASFTIHTAGLEPGHAYTVWWIIFNQPAYCTNPMLPELQCGFGDLPFPEFGLHGDPRVEASIVRAAGHVIGSDGRASFAGHRRAGDGGGTIFGPGLANVARAEIILDIVDHGPANHPGYVDDQIHTFPHGPESCNSQCVDEQLAGLPGLS